MNKTALILVLVSITLSCFGQQYALYNSRTLFDSFENPAQKAFVPDSSKKFASNFLIPTVSINAVSLGPQQLPIKRATFLGVIRKAEVDKTVEGTNRVFLSSNIYVGMFRVFKDIKKRREMGFSWQIKSDTYINASQETIRLFNDFNNFTPSTKDNPFNNTGNSQSYHQFGFTYRKDINRRTGVGIKLSYLSGISYNYLKIKSSSIQKDPVSRTITANMDGRFKSNFLYDDPYEIALIPGFRNPGMAITLSASHKLKNNWYLMGNLKDLGFIRWGSDSYTYQLDKIPPTNRYSELEKFLKDFISYDYEQKSTSSFVNGKAEILLNKNTGSYQPNFVVSKSFLYKGTDVVLINNLVYKSSVFSLTGIYNTNSYGQLGGQYLFKTPNHEFFIGSDNLFKTLSVVNGYNQQDPEVGDGYTGASFYLGFSVKFGPSVQRRANATEIPGIEY